MEWFKNMPVLVKAFGFALVTVIIGLIGVVLGTALHTWVATNYGESTAENMWGVLGILVVLTGLSWLWQVLE